MAIVLDKANVGSTFNNASATTIALTTSQIVASGGFIELSVGWFNAVTITGVSGGGLTWTVDKQGHPTNPAAANSAVVSAQAPSGLASGTTITVTFLAAAVARCISATSYTGVATSSAVDGTPPATAGVSPAAAGWASTSTSISAGSLLAAVAYNETNPLTNTVTSPSVQDVLVSIAGSVSMVTCHRIETSAAAYTVAGTWSGSAQTAINAVAYLAASGGGTDLTVTPGTPNVAWAGTTPALNLDRVLVPGTPTVAWTGSTPTLTTTGDLTVTPGTAVTAWAGSTPGIAVDKSLSPGTPNVAWSGSTPDVLLGKTLTPGTATVAWSGSTPSVILEGEVTLTPGVATVAWSGSTPVLSAVPDVVIEPPSQGGDGGDGDEDFSTEDARSLVLRPGAAEVRWSGSRASVRVELDPARFRLPRRRERPVAPLPAVSLTLSPRAALVAYSGSKSAVRSTSLVAVDDLRAELAQRDEKLAKLEARLDEMQREHEEEFAILAALSAS